MVCGIVLCALEQIKYTLQTLTVIIIIMKNKNTFEEVRMTQQEMYI